MTAPDELMLKYFESAYDELISQCTGSLVVNTPTESDRSLWVMSKLPVFPSKYTIGASVSFSFGGISPPISISKSFRVLVKSVSLIEAESSLIVVDV